MSAKIPHPGQLAKLFLQRFHFLKIPSGGRIREKNEISRIPYCYLIRFARGCSEPRLSGLHP